MITFDEAVAMYESGDDSIYEYLTERNVEEWCDEANKYLNRYYNFMLWLSAKIDIIGGDYDD